MQGAVSLASAWDFALNPARVPSVVAAIPEELTIAMLRYAVAPAQLPPSGITCEAWLSQAYQRRSVSVLMVFVGHCMMAVLMCSLVAQHPIMVSLGLLTCPGALSVHSQRL